MLQANLPTAIAAVETNGKANPYNKLVVKWFSAQAKMNDKKPGAHPAGIHTRLAGHRGWRSTGAT